MAMSEKGNVSVSLSEEQAALLLPLLQKQTASVQQEKPTEYSVDDMFRKQQRTPSVLPLQTFCMRVNVVGLLLLKRGIDVGS